MTDPGKERTPGELMTVSLLFVGLSCLAGLPGGRLVGTPAVVLGGLLVLAMLCLLPGVFRLAASTKRVRIVLCALIPAVLVSPVAATFPLLPLLAIQYAEVVVNGPRIVQSAVSPDGNFEAYVVDEPCADGPDHTLYIQRKDEIHFVYVANLAADVDAIQAIQWSPLGDVVVFRARDNLIATRVPGFQTVKIPLGPEWTRTRPGKRSTFTSGGLRRQIAVVEFPEPGAFRYRMEGDATFRSIHMGSL